MRLTLSRAVSFFLLCSIVGSGCYAADDLQVHGDAAYARPHSLDFITKTPSDLKEFGKKTFSRESIPVLLVVAGTTGLLMLTDQTLLDKSRHLGTKLDISRTNYQKTLVSIPVGKSKLGIEGPFDSGSALYFIGDGTVDVMLAAGFLTYGVSGSNNRALQTSSQIIEAILTSGLVAQVIKHVSGRGSPFTNDEPGGDWRFFPRPSAYARHVSSYDAFPSGHLTASMATLTVISENYSEYHWIRPVGYTLFGVLGFEMLNNGVHWASDYPLALLIGYSFGKIITSRERHNVQAAADPSEVRVLPYIDGSDLGLRVVWRFSGSRDRS